MIAGGLIAHGIFDIAAGLIDTPGPVWWPAFCAAFDIVAGVAMVRLIQVHAYTSPHLARFHERIRLAGTLISEPALTDILDRCYTANGPDPITYFEITTVAGILAFAQTPADFTLLEVGLGGRLDATNVVDTLLDLPLPALSGPHQIQNAGAAIATLRHLRKDDTACEAALTNATWPARMEHLKTGALVDLAHPAELWLDGGHNPAAGRALAATLRAQPERPTHLICGMLNTKDIGGYLAPLAQVAATLTAVSIPDEANTIPAQTTAQEAAKVGLHATTAPDVQTAIARGCGLHNDGPHDLTRCGDVQNHPDRR